jgi:hypothetical protein
MEAAKWSIVNKVGKKWALYFKNLLLRYEIKQYFSLAENPGLSAKKLST